MERNPAAGAVLQELAVADGLTQNRLADFAESEQKDAEFPVCFSGFLHDLDPRRLQQRIPVCQNAGKQCGLIDQMNVNVRLLLDAFRPVFRPRFPDIVRGTDVEVKLFVRDGLIFLPQLICHSDIPVVIVRLEEMPGRAQADFVYLHRLARAKQMAMKIQLALKLGCVFDKGFFRRKKHCSSTLFR